MYDLIEYVKEGLQICLVVVRCLFPVFMIKIQWPLAYWAYLAFGLGLDFRLCGLQLTGGGANGARKEDWTEVYKSSIWSSWLLTRPRSNWSLTQSLFFLCTSTVPKRQTSVLPLFSAVYKPSLIKSSVYKDLSTVPHHPKYHNHWLALGRIIAILDRQK